MTRETNLILPQPERTASISPDLPCCTNCKFMRLERVPGQLVKQMTCSRNPPQIVAGPVLSNTGQQGWGCVGSMFPLVTGEMSCGCFERKETPIVEP